MACLHFQHSPSAGTGEVGTGGGLQNKGGWWVSGIAILCCILSDSRHTGRVAATRTEGLPPLITTVTTRHRQRQEKVGGKESVALIESDDSVIKPRTKGEIMKFDRDFER